MPQNGEWGSGENAGRQYWDGQWGEKGVIMNPNEVGYGKKVSSEVNQAGSIAAGLDAGAYDRFISGGNTDVSGMLNAYQNDIYSKVSAAPSIKVPTMDELKLQLEPEIKRPTLLNRSEERQTLREDYGVAALEESLTKLKGQEEELLNSYKQQMRTETGKPVSMGVISGRKTQVQQQAQDELEFVQRQKNRLVDELNVKYTVINQLMQDKTLDYNDAVAEYDKEYQRNFQMHEIIRGYQKDSRDEYWKQQAAASTNLQMYVNLVTKGNMDYASLGEDQKLMITKLEVQAGLPIGFMAGVKKDKDADILFTTSNEGVTQVGFRNADGSISVQSYGTRVGGSAGAKIQMHTDARNAFDSVKGGDGYVDPKDYKTFKSYWVGQGGDAQEFDKQFAPLYVNPSHPQSYGVSKEQTNPDYYKDQSLGY